jgi:hypothetical protein
VQFVEPAPKAVKANKKIVDRLLTGAAPEELVRTLSEKRLDIHAPVQV